MKIMYDWNTFVQLKNANELNEYFDSREYKHNDYCHYTSLKVVNDILQENMLWLGNVNGFNDKKDSEQFDDEKNLYYSFCFSTGVRENLSLWYMYAGMRGDGGRIRLTSNAVRTLIEKGTYRLYEYDSDNKKLIKEIALLNQNESMELIFKDVLYFRKSENSVNCDLKYNTMTNYNIKNEELDKYIKRYKGFVKGLIWYYEKETRLLVKLIGKAKTLIENNKNYIVTLNFDKDIRKKIKIDFAPEITNENLKDKIQNREALKEFVFESSRADLSKHSGEIEMGFCNKCDKKHIKI